MQVRAPSLISTMVTRTVICISPSEAATLAAEASWSSAEADSIIKKATTSTCYSNSSDNKSDGGKKRALPSEDIIGGNDSKKRQKADGFEIDLNDVPRQQPIPKSKRHMKEGSSKYAGVSFRKATNKWLAQILIEGTNRRIGDYVNVEEAAIDYARAVFKYRGQEALEKEGEQNKFALPKGKLTHFNSELETYVELQVGFRTIRVQQRGVMRTAPAHSSDCSTSRDDAYWGGKKRALPMDAQDSIIYEDTVIPQSSSNTDRRFEIDLSDVPMQPPIPKSKGRMKEGASKYAGVSFRKTANKWVAQIAIEGKLRYIGYYENEEEAAIDYAKAVFKYKGQDALDKARKRKSSGSVHAIDLSDVPPQPPILKSKGRIKEGASKYAGVTFSKANKKWMARIMIDGKERSIGYYENEEEAAIDYARALFKYKGQQALNKAREQNSSGFVEQNSSGSGIVTSYSTSSNAAYRNRGEKKRVPTSEASISYEETTAIKHQRINAFGKSNFLPHVIPIKATSVAATKASNISSAPIVQTNQQRSHYLHTPWQLATSPLKIKE